MLGIEEFGILLKIDPKLVFDSLFSLSRRINSFKIVRIVDKTLKKKYKELYVWFLHYKRDFSNLLLEIVKTPKNKINVENERYNRGMSSKYRFSSSFPRILIQGSLSPYHKMVSKPRYT